MRHRGVKRSKARGRGVGPWCHGYAEYADSLSTRERKGSIFGFFQKSAFTGSMWTIGKNNAKHVCYTDKRFLVDGHRGSTLTCCVCVQLAVLTILTNWLHLFHLQKWASEQYLSIVLLLSVFRGETLHQKGQWDTASLLQNLQSFIQI